VIAEVPVEKIFRFIPEVKILLSQNTFQPVMQHNNLYINGFYSELKAFISVCEKTTGERNISGLQSLISTYKLFNDIANVSNADFNL
jgi:hypothetical protein